jgi:hypothetical protein
MTWPIIAAAIYLLGAAFIVAAWAYGSKGEEDRMWRWCAVAALLWPLLLVGGLLG